MPFSSPFEEGMSGTETAGMWFASTRNRKRNRNDHRCDEGMSWFLEEGNQRAGGRET